MLTLQHALDALPEAAKDLRLNVQTLLQSSTLDAPQRWGVAAAVVIAAGATPLREPLLAAALEAAGAAVLDDARAAAAVMTMNNVYYRFRHQVGKDSYAALPARLRMQRLAAPKAEKNTMELMSLAVSAVNGCETCVQAHEHAVLESGLTEAHVHDAVRLAAAVHAAAVMSAC